MKLYTPSRDVVSIRHKPGLGWLRSIRAALACTAKIDIRPIRDQWAYREAARFGFASKRIHARLLAIGIKTRPPEMPDEMLPHFIRGFFDGDGSAYQAQGKNHCSFVGPLWMMAWVRETLIRIAGVSPGTNPHVKSNSPHIYSLAYGARDSEKIGRLMYAASSICLKRKRNKF